MPRGVRGQRSNWADGSESVRKAAVSLQNSTSELTTLKCWILTGHFIRYLRLRAAPGGHFISHEEMSRRDGLTVREERQ